MCINGLLDSVYCSWSCCHTLWPTCKTSAMVALLTLRNSPLLVWRTWVHDSRFFANEMFEGRNWAKVKVLLDPNNYSAKPENIISLTLSLAWGIADCLVEPYNSYKNSQSAHFCPHKPDLHSYMFAEIHSLFTKLLSKGQVQWPLGQCWLWSSHNRLGLEQWSPNVL